jgi:RNA polymerase sigma-70 factor (ECF subfamily)
MPQDRVSESGAVEPLPHVADGLPGERQLIADILQRDRKAAAQFVSRYTDAVYGYVRHRLGRRTDMVDDMVQDVFIAALGGLAQFRGESSLRSWLLGIARHKVEDFYRRQLQAPESLDEEADGPASADPPLDEAIDRERARAKTQQILQQLPEQYGLALLWRYWENRSVRDIAAATGKTEKAIERTLARARTQFRALWERS